MNQANIDQQKAARKKFVSCDVWMDREGRFRFGKYRTITAKDLLYIDSDYLMDIIEYCTCCVKDKVYIEQVFMSYCCYPRR